MASVLVVEDEMMIALSLERTLEDFGFASVQLAMSITQAFEAIDAASFDCAIVDYKLGDMTADTLLAALEARGIPYLVVTGYDDRALSDLARAGWPILSKPLNIAMLQAALSDMGLP